jgi:hypothetical protein
MKIVESLYDHREWSIWLRVTGELIGFRWAIPEDHQVANDRVE